MLNAFNKLYPEIELQVVEAANDQLVELVARGRIDVTLAGSLDGHQALRRHGVQLAELYREQVVFVADRGLLESVYGMPADQVSS